MHKALLMFLALGASSAVMADSLIYAGIAGGRSDFNSSNDTNYGIYVGTGLLPILDVEAGYSELGKFAATGGDVSLSSVYAAVRPTFNVGSLQLYAKAGIHYWDLDAGSRVVNFKDDSKYDLMWGIGAEYAVFGPVSLGVSYTNYRIEEKNLGTAKLTVSMNLL